MDYHPLSDEDALTHGHARTEINVLANGTLGTDDATRPNLATGADLRAILDHALPSEVRFVSRSKRDGATRVNVAGEPGDSWMLDALQQYRTLRSG